MPFVVRGGYWAFDTNSGIFANDNNYGIAERMVRFQTSNYIVNNENGKS